MKERALYSYLRENLTYLEFGGNLVLRAFDLTVTHYDALRLLSLEEGQRMGELGKRLLCDNSKMTRIIDHLAERGLAERRPDAEDRRAWQVFLTPAGETLRDQAAAVHETYLQEQFAILDDSEQVQLAQHLDRLRQRIKPSGETND